MRRFIGIMLLLFVTIGCNAQNKVRGELRTEINGFQWYNNNNKEAFTIDGRNLFDNLKGIKSIDFLVADKNDDGLFWIKLKDNFYGLYDRNGLKIGQYNLKGNPSASRRSELFNSSLKIYFTIVGLTGKHHRLIFSNGECCVYSTYIINKNTILFNDDYSEFEYGDIFWNYVFSSDGKEIISYKDGYKSYITYNETANHYIKKDNEGNISIVNQNGVALTRNLIEAVYNHDYIAVKSKEGKVGIMNFGGSWIVPLEKGYNDFKPLYNIKRYVVKYHNSTDYHLITNDGNDVLGDGFDEIKSTGSNFVIFKNDNNYGIMTPDGKKIIPTSRGYTFISDFNATNKTFAFTKKGYRGVCNEQGEEISLTKLPPTADDIKETGSYASATELMDSSMMYWKVSKGGRYGLTDAQGKVIVPTEMEALESAGTGYLRYKLNGFWGLMNYSGKIIIDTDRGYTSIGDFKTFNKRFPYTMNGYKGECDINGRQISKIKVETPQQQVVVKKEETPQKQEEKKIIIEHKHDPVPMQVWKQCTICFGSGKCQTCGGSGIYYGAAGNSTLCTFGCGGSGRCSFCAGQGGHYEVEYR